MLSSLKLLLITLSIKIQQVFLVAIEIIRGRLSFYPPSVRSFEANFASDFKVNHALMFTNATSAIEAAMHAVGVKSNSIVGTTAFVIPSSYSSAFNLGAKIEFLDINANTLNLDFESLVTNNDKKITTLVVTHFFGNPCNMEKIMIWANDHDVTVIEDCSHAHGAAYKDKSVGAWGHIGIFSLQGSKTVSAGEGAVAITNDDVYYAKMVAYGHQESYKTFGIDRFAYNLPAFGYGRKMRVHPLGAVLAKVDYKYLRQKNSVYYNWFKELQSLSLESNYFSIQKVCPNSTIAGYCQGVAIILNDELSALNFIEKLNKNRVNCYRRNYLESIDYFGSSTELSKCIDAFDRVVFITFYQFIDFRRWSKLIDILKRGDNEAN